MVAHQPCHPGRSSGTHDYPTSGRRSPVGAALRAGGGSRRGPGGPECRRVLRPGRDAGRRVYSCGPDEGPGAPPGSPDGRVSDDRAARSAVPARKAHIRDSDRRQCPHHQGATGAGCRRDGRAHLPAVRGGPDLPGNARAGAGPSAPRPHRGAELVRPDQSGSASGALPRHRAHRVQPTRGRRSGNGDRRNRAARGLGPHQGERRAGVRRRSSG